MSGSQGIPKMNMHSQWTVAPESVEKGRRIGWPSKKLFRLTMLVLFLLQASAPCLRAQTSASIKGIVTDPTGAPVPSSTVNTKNLETGATRTTSTDDAGRYLLLSLPVGEYELRVTKAGFQEAVRSGIRLVVGQEASVDLKLQLREVSAEVRVRGDAPIVSTTTSDISGLVGEQQVRD